MKSENQPHAKRRGQLKNGNPSGDFSKASRCGAMTRKKISCMSPAMKNGRCRMHGGASTGPKTPEGLARAKRANWKHGRYSDAAIEKRKEFNALIRATDEMMKFLRQER